MQKSMAMELTTPIERIQIMGKYLAILGMIILPALIFGAATKYLDLPFWWNGLAGVCIGFIINRYEKYL